MNASHTAKTPVPARLRRCLSVRQLTRFWRVSPARVRQLIRRGTIDAFGVGEKRTELRISPEAIREAERKLTVRRPAPRRPARADDDGISPTVRKLLGIGEGDT